MADDSKAGRRLKERIKLRGLDLVIPPGAASGVKVAACAWRLRLSRFAALGLFFCRKFRRAARYFSRDSTGLWVDNVNPLAAHRFHNIKRLAFHHNSIPKRLRGNVENCPAALMSPNERNS